MFWRNVFVNAHERALIAKNQRYTGILLPGEHRIFSFPGLRFEVEKHDARKLVFRSIWTNHLVNERPDVIAQHFTKVETNREQLAMVYVNGSLFRVLTPEKRLLFWRGEAEVSYELIQVVADLDSAADLFEKLIIH